MTTMAYARDDLTFRIIGAAIAVHTALGPGFLEKVYENALCHVRSHKSGIKRVSV